MESMSGMIASKCIKIAFFANTFCTDLHFQMYYIGFSNNKKVSISVFIILALQDVCQFSF